MKRLFAIICLLTTTTTIAFADIYEEWESRKQKALNEYSNILEKANENFERKRRKANEDFAQKMMDPWVPSPLSPVEVRPIFPSPEPVKEDPDTIDDPFSTPIDIHNIIPIPSPVPQPEPIEPIAVIEDGEQQENSLTINLYGTEFQVRKPDLMGFKISGKEGKDFAKAWLYLNNERTNNLIYDCLNLRKEKNLCDWAYLQILQKISEEVTNNDKNASALLTGFLFNQSGYKMRFALDEKKQLHLCVNTTGIMYDTPLIVLNGERYYFIDNKTSSGNTFEICDFSFPGEQSMSFEISKPIKLDYKEGNKLSVTAKYHPEIRVQVTTNQNLINFYNSYPQATVTTDPYTRWSIYANTPVSDEIKNSVYPILKKAVEGKTQLEAVNIILHLSQSFDYGYDEEIWGEDRPFFMDESWHYPLSDCEDHAINFTRMVRDIVGLDVALVYYPNHLAAAVAFTEPEIPGDCVQYAGKNYTICDPTIFYSNVGKTMRGMDNTQAVLIPLR